MNYYEHHLGDYMRDTAHLSMVEDGAYRRLIDAYYIAEEPLPDDKREVMKIARATTKAERDAVEYVLRKFFVYEAGSGWMHKRCSIEIARFQDKQRKARASAEARWSQSERNANASPNAMRTHSERNADGMHRAPVPSHQSPVKEKYTPPSGAPLAAARPKSRGLRLPADWTPGDDGIAFAEAQGLRNGRAGKELDRFRDYWTSQPGQKGVKADWPATWRNWVRKAVETIPKSAASDDVFAGSH